jgi:heme oxygenase (mycobilin-producing)
VRPRSCLSWEAARDYLQTQLGYVDTALHRAITPDADFRFVNVGRWQSPQHFQAAIQSPGFAEASKGLAGYRPHPALRGRTDVSSSDGA